MVDARQVAKLFRKRYGTEPRLFRAPGRVNLIGEHTDYNDGFVMPVAIDRDTIVAARLREDGTLRVYSENVREESIIDLAKPVYSKQGEWSSYIEGVARVLMSKGYSIAGADLVILSDVPEGAGLSSSAALELSVGEALTVLNNISIDDTDLALAAQRAEHQYAGTQCGIMDQLISVAGQVDHALLIDCQTLTCEPIPIHSADVTWIVVDTKVKHSLASSAYNERRKQCEIAVRVLQRRFSHIEALRDVTLEMLAEVRADMKEIIFRRARHVILENDRTLRAAKALGAGDMGTMGKLMFESHYSLRDDYEVSCKELDQLVDSASRSEGCFGARMTGGGFGGCTINLVRREQVAEFTRRLESDYRQAFGTEPGILHIRSAQGAHEVKI